MKVAVISFPGSSGDVDAYHAVEETTKAEVNYISSLNSDSLAPYDLVVLPGGAAYGNYLRPGALASQDPIIPALKEFAQAGGIVLGLANGFQILTEIGLLPGAFLINPNLKFINRSLDVKVEQTDTIFTNQYEKDQILNLPLANKKANYQLSELEVEKLEKNGQIIFRYEEGHPTSSTAGIAGVTNQEGNVLGLMLHAERAVEHLIHNEDGAGLFQSIEDHLAQKSSKEAQA